MRSVFGFAAVASGAGVAGAFGLVVRVMCSSLFAARPVASPDTTLSSSGRVVHPGIARVSQEDCKHEPTSRPDRRGRSPQLAARCDAYARGPERYEDFPGPAAGGAGPLHPHDGHIIPIAVTPY